METFNTVGTGKPDPKTIGFNKVGTGKPDPKTIYGQRPYMGKDHIWDSTQWDKETGPKDHRIQQSWDRETRSKDHNGQRPYMGFNTVGQENQNRIQHSWQENKTQRPYMGKDHIWDSTQWDRKIRPKRR